MLYREKGERKMAGTEEVRYLARCIHTLATDGRLTTYELKGLDEIAGGRNRSAAGNSGMGSVGPYGCGVSQTDR